MEDVNPSRSAREAVGKNCKSSRVRFRETLLRDERLKFRRRNSPEWSTRGRQSRGMTAQHARKENPWNAAWLTLTRVPALMLYSRLLYRAQTYSVRTSQHSRGMRCENDRQPATTHSMLAAPTCTLDATSPAHQALPRAWSIDCSPCYDCSPSFRCMLRPLG